jgi:hypothetical protein
MAHWLLQGTYATTCSMSAKRQTLLFPRPRNPACWLAGLVLWATVSTATAAAPKEALVTREMQNLYRIGNDRIGSPTTYIRTVNCNEYVYGDRVSLKLGIGPRGGAMVFRSGRICTIDRFLREIHPNRLDMDDSPPWLDVPPVKVPKGDAKGDPKGDRPKPPVER